MSNSLLLQQLKEAQAAIQNVINASFEELDSGQNEMLDAAFATVSAARSNIERNLAVKASFEEMPLSKPLASEIDSKDTDELLAEFGEAVFSRDVLEAQLAKLGDIRKAKQAFKEANALVFEQEKALNEDERNTRRKVYAMLGNAYQYMNDEDFGSFTETIPNGLGYTPRYEVRGDELAIFNWCLEHGQHFLTVNRGYFDAHVKMLADMAYYTKRPMIAPPAMVMECILPTISPNLDEVKKPKKGKKKSAQDDSLPQNTEDIDS